jgi:hypothetical protein
MESHFSRCAGVEITPSIFQSIHILDFRISEKNSKNSLTKMRKKILPHLDCFFIEKVIKARPSEVFDNYLEAAMLNKECSKIPRELCDWITILSKSLPVRAVSTCLELLIGAMLTRSGFVTQSWVMLNT